MTLPAFLRNAVKLPVFGAPMFLVSFPLLVKALSKAGIVIYSDRFSGAFANFLLPSSTRHGIDPAALPPKRPDLVGLADLTARTWRDIWSAGHGIATIHEIPTVEELANRLAAAYLDACGLPKSAAVAA
jgi:nitronate monooxygenase